MFSRFTLDARPTETPAFAKVSAKDSAPASTVFRPPSLSDAPVVTNPFERGGPRLRCLEFFEAQVW